MAALRSILGIANEDDADLENNYPLDDKQVAAVVSVFGAFDPRQLPDEDLEIWLRRRPRPIETPYLVHTGWELPLLLDGRKKLARFSDVYSGPSPTFDFEEAFDHWVANGVLHKEVVDEPLEKPAGKWLGREGSRWSLDATHNSNPAGSNTWPGRRRQLERKSTRHDCIASLLIHPLCR